MKGSLRAKIQRLAEIIRGEGLRTLWFRFLGETVYRRVYLYERPFAKAPHSGSGIPVDIRLLTSDEIQDYLAVLPGQNATTVISRLAQGHRCLVARHEGSIVSYVWAGTRSAIVNYLKGEILLAPRDLYIYGLYTHPKFRNFNIPAVLADAYIDCFQASGCSRVVSVVTPENGAGIRMVEKRGARRFGTISSLRIGPWRHDHCRIFPGSSPVGWRPRPS